MHICHNRTAVYNVLTPSLIPEHMFGASSSSKSLNCTFKCSETGQSDKLNQLDSFKVIKASLSPLSKLLKQPVKSFTLFFSSVMSFFCCRVFSWQTCWHMYQERHGTHFTHPAFTRASNTKCEASSCILWSWHCPQLLLCTLPALCIYLLDGKLWQFNKCYTVSPFWNEVKTCSPVFDWFSCLASRAANALASFLPWHLKKKKLRQSGKLFAG